MTDFHPASADAELQNNDSRAVTINGSKVLICRAAGELYAVENRCTHQEAELEGGRIRGCFISCPLHGVRFDLRDGSPDWAADAPGAALPMTCGWSTA